MSRAVHAVIPLSLLEAMRNLDTPIDDGLAELAPEMVTKRLGLSQTVGLQIERYLGMAERQGTVDLDEAVSVFRLVGRREDAQLVFADAGRRAARHTVRGISGLGRSLLRMTPRALRRRFGTRMAASAAGLTLGAAFSLEAGRAAALPEARIELSLAARADALGDGCYFYGAAFAELLRLLSGFEGAMIHERCRGRGDGTCAWRATTVEGYQ